MSVDKANEVIQVVLGVIAIITSLYGLHRWARPPINRWVKATFAPYLAGIAALEALPAALETCGKVSGLAERIDLIYDQVMPDGGSSMRDSLTRTETAIAGLAEAQTLHAGAFWASLNADPDTAAFEADGTGAIRQVNSSFLRWVNRSASELMGWGWINCVVPADRDRVRGEWAAAVRERRQLVMRYTMRASDGTAFEVEVNATPLPEGSTGAIQRWAGFIRRVSDAAIAA